MRPRLLLVRHGNTFAPGDKVVTVGRKQDLPLVASGRHQAEVLAERLKALAIPPGVLLCGPLRRARETAQIIAAPLDMEPQIDARLDELDYGRWAGLSDPEIAARFGEHPLRAWRDRGIWPTDAGWEDTEAEVLARVRALAMEAAAAGGVTVAVSSNGVLRSFLKLIPGAFEARADAMQLKMATGHVGLLEYFEGHFELRGWNLAPSALGPETLGPDH